MTNPIFSVVIPGYNRVTPLKYTLRSAADAIARLPGGGEIILVDDGSVPPLAAQLADFIPGAAVRHVRQENQGSIIARLAGLQAAQGDFVLFLDSDDLIHPDKLVRHLEALQQAATDVAYDDMAVATLGPDFTAKYQPGPRFAGTTDAVELFLKVQPAPHGPTYRRSFLQSALVAPTVPPVRRMDPAGDVWLYYNLSRRPARILKLDLPLTATGPHEDLRYSQHWEALGAAALLVAESFIDHCPVNPESEAVRRAVGEVAFRSWRRLPRDYAPDYAERLLAVWQRSPRGAFAQLGGPLFRALALALGPKHAGRVLRWRNPTYASCRTMTDDELQRILSR